jgi:hypothetical protein
MTCIFGENSVTPANQYNLSLIPRFKVVALMIQNIILLMIYEHSRIIIDLKECVGK